MAEIVTISQPDGSHRSRSRLRPTIVIVVFLAALAGVAPFLVKYRDAPAMVVAKLEAMSAPQPAPPETGSRDRVWVNRRSGFYYCRDSKFYGKMSPGISMQQESALLEGFRPAEGQKCR